ncbi:ParB/RepB/Spo0J family partition protein [Anatilimnocola floriformis]|uniref:ParB/RepB/Spo0J family partition protein n=1 Tax=Anatilimnocola floriformis TaxID=2948575 RepID=UPI0020C55EBE|nr:ParB N-terminal domain-containing protein [Anatilimnocola floriformis]
MKYEHSQLQVITTKGNVRKSISALAIAELAASLKQHGQQVAIICYRHGEWLIVIDGHCRLEAAKQLGWERMHVCILDAEPTPRQLKIAQLNVNCRRQEVNAVDLYQSYSELVADGMSPTELAASLGVQAAKVTGILALGKLSPEQRELVRSGKIPLSTAYAAARLPESERDACLQKVANGELTRDEVQAKAKRKKPGSSVAGLRRVNCALPNAVVTVSAESGLDLSSLIDTLDDLIRRCRKARSQGWDISTAMRVLRDSAKPAALASHS